MNINKISDIVQFQIKNIFGLEKKEEIELNIIGGGGILSLPMIKH